ncbi:MAG: DUF971 domain-containing protein [Pseudomonadota bacterium]
MSADPDKPSHITLHKRSKSLEMTYTDGRRYDLPFEFLRVHSPSAEVRGHGATKSDVVVLHRDSNLVSGKKEVVIKALEQAGHYALHIIFDDGHASGIYTWRYLAELGRNHSQLWDQYLRRLEEVGRSRDPDVQVLKLN